MRTIYKYSVQPVGLRASIPAAARIVRFAAQGDDVCMWADLETGERPVRREFAVFGTGVPIPRDAIYVASCEQGRFVWHLFELPSQGPRK